jgi:hypothetical protein
MLDVCVLWARRVEFLGAEAADWLVLNPETDDTIKSIGGIIIGRGRLKYSDKDLP